MKTGLAPEEGNGERTGFTLVEVLVGVVILAIMFTVLYVGITAGFGVIQSARENLRATQILQEKTETLRLLTWEDLHQMQRRMAEPFYAPDSDSESGLNYDLQVTVADVSPITDAAYASDIKLVTVEATWVSGGIPRRRSMSTYVSRYGLHRYRY
jgi:prepilin-type N-terminal cleavage/methylation domain-containing protein